MKRRCFFRGLLVSASFVAATAVVLPASAKGKNQDVRLCLAVNPSQRMENLAEQIVATSILGFSWSALATDLRHEVRRVASDRCGVSNQEATSPDFDALVEFAIYDGFHTAIDNAIGGRAISPKTRPTFNSGTVLECLFAHSKPIHKALVVATVYEKLARFNDAPGHKALSAHLAAIAQRHCALEQDQVASAQFGVTVADYIYDSSFRLLMPLLASPR
jgi:hypothetical protein